MKKKDYYQILGLKWGANLDEIKNAYKKLALHFHPDLNPGNQAAANKFVEINEAYAILGNQEKKHHYDQELGLEYYQNAYHDEGLELRNFTHQYFGKGNTYSQVLEDMLRKKQAEKQKYPAYEYQFPKKGKDLEGEIEISLEEVYFGSQKKIKVEGRTLTIEVKPGTMDGHKLVAKGKGQAGINGGDAGDLYIVVRLQGHPNFKRKGDDLLMNYKIDIVTASLGGTVVIETLAGPLQINMPAGTDSGKVLRIREKGLPKFNFPHSYGDLYMKIAIEVPKKLSYRQRELLKQLNL